MSTSAPKTRHPSCKPWTIDEDKHLCRTWRSLARNNRSKDDFWDAIAAIVNERMHRDQNAPSTLRSGRGAYSRFQIISNDTHRFTQLFDAAAEMNPEGKTYYEAVVDCMKAYKSSAWNTLASPYLFLHCWEEIRNSRRWISAIDSRESGGRLHLTPVVEPESPGGDSDIDHRPMMFQHDVGLETQPFLQHEPEPSRPVIARNTPSPEPIKAEPVSPWSTTELVEDLQNDFMHMHTSSEHEASGGDGDGDGDVRRPMLPPMRADLASRSDHDDQSRSVDVPVQAPSSYVAVHHPSPSLSAPIAADSSHNHISSLNAEGSKRIRADRNGVVRVYEGSLGVHLHSLRRKSSALESNAESSHANVEGDPSATVSDTSVREDSPEPQSGPQPESEFQPTPQAQPELQLQPQPHPQLLPLPPQSDIASDQLGQQDEDVQGHMDDVDDHHATNTADDSTPAFEMPESSSAGDEIMSNIVVAAALQNPPLPSDSHNSRIQSPDRLRIPVDRSSSNSDASADKQQQPPPSLPRPRRYPLRTPATVLPKRNLRDRDAPALRSKGKEQSDKNESTKETHRPNRARRTGGILKKSKHVSVREPPREPMESVFPAVENEEIPQGAGVGKQEQDIEIEKKQLEIENRQVAVENRDSNRRCFEDMYQRIVEAAERNNLLMERHLVYMQEQTAHHTALMQRRNELEKRRLEIDLFQQGAGATDADVQEYIALQREVVLINARKFVSHHRTSNKREAGQAIVPLQEHMSQPHPKKSRS